MNTAKTSSRHKTQMILGKALHAISTELGLSLSIEDFKDEDLVDIYDSVINKLSSLGYVEGFPEFIDSAVEYNYGENSTTAMDLFNTSNNNTSIGSVAETVSVVEILEKNNLELVNSKRPLSNLVVIKPENGEEVTGFAKPVKHLVKLFNTEESIILHSCETSVLTDVSVNNNDQVRLEHFCLDNFINTIETVSSNDIILDFDDSATLRLIIRGYPYLIGSISDDTHRENVMRDVSYTVATNFDIETENDIKLGLLDAFGNLFAITNEIDERHLKFSGDKINLDTFSYKTLKKHDKLWGHFQLVNQHYYYTSSENVSYKLVKLISKL